MRRGALHAAWLSLACVTAGAVEPAFEVPMRDPWVPHALRKEVKPEARAVEGSALRALVENKLRAAFEAASPDGSGTLTRGEARAAGLGFVAEHFDAIDRQGAGRVRFEDFRRFLQSSGWTRMNLCSNPPETGGMT